MSTKKRRVRNFLEKDLGATYIWYVGKSISNIS